MPAAAEAGVWNPVSVRKCDNAKLLERVSPPFDVKPLQRALSKQQRGRYRFCPLEQVTFKKDSLPGLAHTAKLDGGGRSRTAELSVTAERRVLSLQLTHS
jgi:hypothetical protein